MTIANLNNNLNTYLFTNLAMDLQSLENDAVAEVSKSKADELQKISPNSGLREIKDEFVLSVRQKVDVTLEERLSQVISPEELKNLLSLLMRTPRMNSIPGDLVDVKG